MEEGKKQLPRWKVILITVISFLLLSTGLDFYYHRDRIYAGVCIDKINVGGLTKEKAGHLLAEELTKNNFDQNTVELIINDSVYNKTFAQLGINVDVNSTIDSAFSAGREVLHLFRYPKRLQLARNKLTILPSIQIDQAQFQKELEEILAETEQAAVNASFKLSADREKVEIEPDQPGRRVDIGKTYQAVLESAKSFFAPITIEVPISEVEAEVTAESLASLAITEKIAAFSTVFSTGNANRAHNIRLAAAALDKSLILPNAIFSFNETVGNATAAKGYRAAPVIVNGRLVDGIGGGICQVSSTLYNTVLLADLAIIERRNHGLTVNYLPPGLDATVAYGSIDLKFKNTRPHALWLRTFVDGNKLTVVLYGTKIPGHEVKVYTTNVQKIPAGEKIIETKDLPKGKKELIREGQPGYRATVWRAVYLNGQEERREKISQDTYRAVPAEYRVGTAEIPVTDVTDTQ
ncbi:MAG: hypothetical protein GX922_09000 [Firmicutes bacterium]|mgnify:CR=1 FL=1|nr:hypothetical protein [Bacillota bacterium]